MEHWVNILQNHTEEQDILIKRASPKPKVYQELYDKQLTARKCQLAIKMSFLRYSLVMSNLYEKCPPT